MDIITTLAIGGLLYVSGRAHDRYRRRKRDRLTRNSRRSLTDESYRDESPYYPRVRDPIRIIQGGDSRNETIVQERLMFDRWYDVPQAGPNRSQDCFEVTHQQNVLSLCAPQGLSTGSISDIYTVTMLPYEPSEWSMAPSVAARELPLYQYSPLQNVHAIRLIELHPARDKAADLHCSFYPVDLEDSKEIPISYEAISYAWGEGNAPNKLLCDEKPSFLLESRSSCEAQEMWQLPITDSLDTALRAYRLPTKHRLLWVDAVCINQADGREKMHQVREMKHIYHKAAQVLVWLGEEGQGCGQSLRWLEELGEWRLKFFPFTSEKMLGTEHKALWSSLQGHGMLHHFFLRSWFRRRWVILELVKSRAAVLCCGSVQCKWEPFAAAISFLYEVDSRMALFRGTIHGVLEGLCLMDAMRRQPDLVKDFDLLDSLNVFHAWDTSRPHDRILALISFSNNPEGYIDFGHDYYLLSPQKFYAQFAYNALERTHSLDILHLAGTFRSLDSPPYSASWVPDWRSSPRYKPFLNIRRFSAGIGDPSNPISPPTPVIYPETNCLLLDGFIFGHVAMRSASTTSKSPSYEDICRLTPEYYALAECASIKDERTRNSLAMTLVADRALCKQFPWLPKRSKESPKQLRKRANLELGFLQLCYTALSFSNDADSPPGMALSDVSLDSLETPRSQKYAQQYAALVSMTMSGRRLFRTTNGEIGIGPEDLRQDDYIVIFVGSRTPFVIRLSADGDSFKIVGDCYVHGIMKGEALGKNQWRQFEIS